MVEKTAKGVDRHKKACTGRQRGKLGQAGGLKASREEEADIGKGTGRMGKQSEAESM